MSRREEALNRSRFYELRVCRMQCMIGNWANNSRAVCWKPLESEREPRLAALYDLYARSTFFFTRRCLPSSFGKQQIISHTPEKWVQTEQPAWEQTNDPRQSGLKRFSPPHEWKKNHIWKINNKKHIYTSGIKKANTKVCCSEKKIYEKKKLFSLNGIWRVCCLIFSLSMTCYYMATAWIWCLPVSLDMTKKKKREVSGVARKAELWDNI